MTKITFDKHREVFNTLGSKQFDSSEPFKAEFLNGGEPIDLSQYNIRFECKKPDGNIVVDDENITIKNICEIEMYLNEQVTVVNGKVDCQFVLVNKVNEKQTSTFTFYMDVQQSVLGVNGYSRSLITIAERLAKDIIKAGNLHNDLTNDIVVATPLQKSLRTDINEANTFKDQLNENVRVGSELNIELRQNTINATNVNSELIQSVENAQDNINTINATANNSKIILPEHWVGVEPNLTYTWNHRLNTKNISVDIFDEDTNETLFWSVGRPDENNMVIRSKTRRHLRIVLGAKYYSGGDLNSNEEIIEARKGENSLRTKVDKIDSILAKNENDIILVNDSLAEIAKPVILFTYDDGFIEDDLTYSIFKEYGLTCSFAPISDNMFSTNKNFIDNYRSYEEEGFEIMSHSSSHIHFDAVGLSENTLDYELRVSNKKMRNLGLDINGFVTPYHEMLDVYKPTLKKYYEYAFTGKKGAIVNGCGHMDKNTGVHDLFRISLYDTSIDNIKLVIDNCIKNNGILCFYDHRTGGSASSTELKLREVLTYVKNKVNNREVLVKTVKEGIAYYFGLNIKKRNVGINVMDNLASSFNQWNKTPSTNSSFTDLVENGTDVIKTSFSTLSALNEESTLSFALTIDEIEQVKSIFNQFEIKIDGDSSCIETYLQCRFRKSDNTYIRTNSKEMYLSNNYNTVNTCFSPDQLKEYTSALVTIRFKIVAPITSEISVYIKNQIIGIGTECNINILSNSILYSGDISTPSTIDLKSSIKKYKNIIICANDNGSATANMITMTIPQQALLVGSSTSRYRMYIGVDKMEFSFPTINQIRLDVITGTLHIRGVIGSN